MQEDPIRKGRLAGERPEKVMQYLSSMDADRWIAEADVLVDIAHVLMLDRQQIIDRSSAVAIVRELLALYEQGLPEDVFDDRFEDIHAGIEAFLIDKLGADVGGRLHIARSRNDEVSACIRIRLRSELLSQMQGILSLRRVLLDLADKHRDSIMPGFTHLQHAQPTTLAHHLLAYEQAFGRDFARLRECFSRVNQSPLGSAAFASSGYPIDREYPAELLGFDAVSHNTMDAVSSRDFALEALSDYTIIMNTVSRLSEELVLWSSSFVGFVELDDIHSSTSSIMPQKKNPDTAEIMRAKAGTVSGALVAAVTGLKALPMSYNRDLQEITPHLWKAIHETGSSLDLLAEILAFATFNTDRMREEAGKGYSTATELADTLVREYGLAFRTAHTIVGSAVRAGVLDLETLEAAAGKTAQISLKQRGLTESRIAAALDPSHTVAIRNVPGGPSPAATADSIRIRRNALLMDTEWRETASASIDDAIARMTAEAQELIASRKH